MSSSFCEKKPNIEQSFGDLVKQGFRTRVLRLPLFFFGFITLAVLLNLLNGGDGWEIFSKFIEPTGFKGISTRWDPPLFVFLIIAILVDGFLWALYWFFRTRNPNYIKKMEAYERKKQSLQTGVTEERGHS